MKVVLAGMVVAASLIATSFSANAGGRWDGYNPNNHYNSFASKSWYKWQHDLG